MEAPVHAGSESLICGACMGTAAFPMRVRMTENTRRLCGNRMGGA